jgi:hypothetical protein
VTGADDHRGGGLDADVLGDAAEILLGAQVAGQVRPQSQSVSDGAGHAGEQGEDLGPAEQAREGGEDGGVQGHAVGEVGVQVCLDGAAAGLAGQLAQLALDGLDVSVQGEREELFLAREVVVEHAVGDLGLPGDVAHGEAGGAAQGYEAFGGGDQVLAQALTAAAVTQDGCFSR